MAKIEVLKTDRSAINASMQNLFDELAEALKSGRAVGMAYVVIWDDGGNSSRISKGRNRAELVTACYDLLTLAGEV